MIYSYFHDDEPFPRSVMRLLWEHHPDVREAFRQRGLFVIEFQVGDMCIHEPGALEEAGARAREAYAACSLCDETAAVLFVAHAYVEVARELAASGLEVPGGVFLGACGYMEGGIGFWAADGTVIESEDWTGAGEYALRVAARLGRPTPAEPDTHRESDAVVDASSEFRREVYFLLGKAILEEASEIYLDCDRHGSVLARFRVAGTFVPYRVGGGRGVLTQLKIMARFDIAEHHVPQMGWLPLDYLSDQARVWVATVPTVDGEDFVIRFETPRPLLGLDELGLTPHHREQIDALLRRTGLIIVAGPAQSGRGTMLHAMLAELDTLAHAAYAVERFHQYRVVGARCLPVTLDQPVEHVLAHCVKLNADILLADDLPGGPAIGGAVRAALGSCVVLAGMLVPIAAATLRRVVDLAEDQALALASSLNAILAVRLVPRLCQHCREAYHPPAEETGALRRLAGESAWERLRFPDDLLLYRRSGCAECGGCGYHGRVGLHEVLVLSATLRSLVAGRAPEAALLEQAIADGMITLAEDGLQKAAEGATDVGQLAAAVRA